MGSKNGIQIAIVLIILTEIGLCSVSESENICITGQCSHAAKNLLRDMKLSLDPCDDFYEFTCGKWSENAISKVSDNWYKWNQVFMDYNMEKFFESDPKIYEPKAIQKMRTMYEACMHIDTNYRPKLSEHQSLSKLLRRIDELKERNYNQTIVTISEYLKKLDLPYCPDEILAESTNVSSRIDSEWIESIAKIKKITGLDTIIGFEVIPDPINQTHQHIFLGVQEESSGFSANEKNTFYLNKHDEVENENGEKSEDLRALSEEYYKFIFKFAVFYDFKIKSPAEGRELAERTERFTNALIELKKEADSMQNNSVVSFRLKDFQIATNELIAPKEMNLWRKYLNEIFKDIQPSINLDEITIRNFQSDLVYLQKVTKLISNTSNDVLNFYIWNDILRELWLLYRNEVKMNELVAKKRSTTCMLKTVKSMPKAAAYTVIEPNFFQDTKPKIQAMVENIRLAFQNTIKQVNWIDSETKDKMLKKSNAINISIGLLDAVPDANKLDNLYAELNFNETTHFKNLMNFRKWKMTRKLKLFNSVDGYEWTNWNSLNSVNAYHAFNYRRIFLPHGILQFPFYGLGIDSMNYGAIGSSISHEFVHEFDRKGQQYNENGQHLKWWTNETMSEFENRTKCFINQYDSYFLSEVNQTIDGALTLEENIADNVGLRLAYYAYKLHSNSTEYMEKLLPDLGNYTGDQLFFISYAYKQCEAETIERLKQQLKDTYAQRRARVIGTLSNFDEFHKSFHCTPNSNMVSENQCRIW